MELWAKQAHWLPPLSSAPLAAELFTQPHLLAVKPGSPLAYQGTLSLCILAHCVANLTCFNIPLISKGHADTWFTDQLPILILQQGSNLLTEQGQLKTKTTETQVERPA